MGSGRVAAVTPAGDDDHGVGGYPRTMSAPGPLTLTIGHEELTIRKRYEVVSIVNDVLVALWFVVGSVLFFSDGTETAGTWCFLIGSIELLIRPLIRLSRHLHLQRLAPGASSWPVEASQDF